MIKKNNIISLYLFALLYSATIHQSTIASHCSTRAYSQTNADKMVSKTHCDSCYIKPDILKRSFIRSYDRVKCDTNTDCTDIDELKRSFIRSYDRVKCGTNTDCTDAEKLIEAGKKLLENGCNSFMWGSLLIKVNSIIIKYKKLYIDLQDSRYVI